MRGERNPWQLAESPWYSHQSPERVCRLAETLVRTGVLPGVGMEPWIADQRVRAPCIRPNMPMTSRWSGIGGPVRNISCWTAIGPIRSCRHNNGFARVSDLSHFSPNQLNPALKNLEPFLLHGMDVGCRKARGGLQPKVALGDRAARFSPGLDPREGLAGDWISNAVPCTDHKSNASSRTTARKEPTFRSRLPCEGLGNTGSFRPRRFSCADVSKTLYLPPRSPAGPHWI
ncbi:MAG: hypothetical protein NVS3B12_31960 [Acidimicrobiales bacterium]